MTNEETVSDSDNTSVIAYLRSKKCCCTMATASRREEWEYLRETTLQTPRSVKKEGKEMLQAPEQRFHCSPWSRPWWGRLCPCSPWRSTVEQISTCSPWRTSHRSRWMHLKKAVTPWEVKSVLPMTVIAQWSPCPYLDSHVFSYIFCPRSSWGAERLSGFGGHLTSSQGQLTTVMHIVAPFNSP